MARRKGQLLVPSVPSIMLDLPKRPEWGDLATNLAMVLAPTERRAPQDVAQIIIDNLQSPQEIFDRVEIARPGFLNLTLRRGLWLETLLEIERSGVAFGRSDGRFRRDPRRP